MSLGGGPSSFRESRPFILPLAGLAILAWAVYMAGEVARSFAQGERDLVQSLPGIIGLLAAGLVAVLARQYVEVTATEVRVGNSPYLCRRMRLSDLQRVERKERPPAQWQLTWPLKKVQVYSVDQGPGVLLTLKSGEMVFIGTREPAALVAAISAAAPEVRVEGS